MSKKKTALEIEIELWKNVQKAAIDQHVTYSRVIEMALRGWLEKVTLGTTDTPERTVGHIPASASRDLGNNNGETFRRNPTYSENAESLKWHAVLELVFDSKDPIEINAITSHLHAIATRMCSGIQESDVETVEISFPASLEGSEDIARAIARIRGIGAAGRTGEDESPKRHRGGSDRRTG